MSFNQTLFRFKFKTLCAGILVLGIGTFSSCKGIDFLDLSFQAGIKDIQEDRETLEGSVKTLFVIGTKDQSDREFAPPGSNLYFHVGKDPVSRFPKELNILRYSMEYLYFDLSRAEADKGLTLTLEPVWSNGSGVLYVGVEIWVGHKWLEVGRTPCSMHDAGYIYLHPAFLKVGENLIRLVAYSGTGGTTAVTWDQIKFQTQAQKPTWAFGIKDGSEKEFKQKDYDLVINVDLAGDGDFPKEINNTWYPDQYLLFLLTGEESQRPHQLNLSVAWSDGQGTLDVGLERWEGSRWDRIGTVALSRSQPGVIEVPADVLKEGLNKWRLHAGSGSSGTTTVTWDRIALMERTDQPEVVKNLLREIMDTTLNYFLSPRVIHQSGLPVSAWKVTDRARFGYTNPVEWGYTLQAWIVASEIGKISEAEAVTKIDRSMDTLLTLQRDPHQFKYGLFYPYYTLVKPLPDGSDVEFPYRDKYEELPVGDCALFWSSLNVVHGWLLEKGYMAIVDKVARLKKALNFRVAYTQESGRHYLSMLVNAKTGRLSPHRWIIWADEGGIVGIVAYLSGSLSWSEFTKVLDTQMRPAATWKDITTQESTWFNAAFTWAERIMAGFPMFGDPRERQYGLYSFLPAARSHLAYARFLNLDQVGFSDPMSQTHQGDILGRRYTPPNIPNTVETNPPHHIAPHGLFVWMGALDVLEDSLVQAYFEKILLLKNDSQGYWHPNFSQDPYGFEVVASPYLNDSNYKGADDGRYIFETLSQAYTVLPIYEGLQRLKCGRTFLHFTYQVPGYREAVERILRYAYPEPLEPINHEISRKNLPLSNLSRVGFEDTFGPQPW
ncbi:MAG TPA: hypothetical protein VNM22_14665 [Candidatus Limnocylindrales bacterium]|nr:hypothetical protein [Candidatus Limnocylindrales bacterium]